MLIGTYLKDGRYTRVSVEHDEGERPLMVLERQEDPGTRSGRCALLAEDLAVAIYLAEVHLLARGGLPGAEGYALAGAPVGRQLAESMFSKEGIGNFIHLPARYRPG